MARPNRAQRKRKRERFIALAQSRNAERIARQEQRDQTALLGVGLVRKLSGFNPKVSIDSDALMGRTHYRGCNTFGLPQGSGPKVGPERHAGGQRFAASFVSSVTLLARGIDPEPEIHQPEPEPDAVSYKREGKVWRETGKPLHGAKVVKRPKVR